MEDYSFLQVLSIQSEGFFFLRLDLVFAHFGTNEFSDWYPSGKRVRPTDSGELVDRERLVFVFEIVSLQIFDREVPSNLLGVIWHLETLNQVDEVLLQVPNSIRNYFLDFCIIHLSRVVVLGSHFSEVQSPLDEGNRMLLPALFYILFQNVLPYLRVNLPYFLKNILHALVLTKNSLLKPVENGHFPMTKNHLFL